MNEISISGEIAILVAVVLAANQVLTTVALLWISMTKEWRLGQPIGGVVGLIVAALCLCALIVLVAAYVQKTRSLRKISDRVELITSNGEFRPCASVIS